MREGQPPIWIVLKAHLRADRRKTGVLIALVAVMVVVYARTFWTSDAPQTVEASAPPAAVEAADDSSARSSRMVRISLPEPPPQELDRDPFQIDLMQFPRTDGRPEPPEPTRDFVGPAEDEDLYGAASDLVLQSTICGDSPLACINSRVVRPGEEIDGFVLESVRPTHVVLRRGGLDVILELKRVTR